VDGGEGSTSDQFGDSDPDYPPLRIKHDGG